MEMHESWGEYRRVARLVLKLVKLLLAVQCIYPAYLTVDSCYYDIGGIKENGQ